MPNNAGPCSSKKRFLASVLSSILRYGGPAWVPALETKQNQRKLSSTFRFIAMRVGSAYRTISSEAVCVIAGIIPVSIALAEDSECYRWRDAGRVRKVVRAESLAKWQHEWNTAENVPVWPRLLQEVPASVYETLEHVVFDCQMCEALRREMPVLNVENVVDGRHLECHSSCSENGERSSDLATP
ncbi:uncharacterized protein LOC135701287 [Ochlerotatus camptorhynchus]|uniref:uncharacterized protein LOC135701287 n=1 Tax=Ochlerotatus camptorhynchus TaxID=644619 RepID=UPI0031D644F9